MQTDEIDGDVMTWHPHFAIFLPSPCLSQLDTGRGLERMLINDKQTMNVHTHISRPINLLRQRAQYQKG